MRRRLSIVTTGLCALLLLFATPTSHAAWGDFFQGVRNLIGGSGPGVLFPICGRPVINTQLARKGGW